MTKNAGEGLLILAHSGYNQLSVSDSKIYAGGKNVSIESGQQLHELGWYYDSDFECWIFETVNNEGN